MRRIVPVIYVYTQSVNNSNNSSNNHSSKINAYTCIYITLYYIYTLYILIHVYT